MWLHFRLFIFLARLAGGSHQSGLIQPGEGAEFGPWRIEQLKISLFQSDQRHQRV